MRLPAFPLGLALLALLSFLFLAAGCSDERPALEAAGNPAAMQPQADFAFDPDRVTEIDPDDCDLLGGDATTGGNVDVEIRHHAGSKEFKAGKAGSLNLGGEVELKVGDDALAADLTVQGDAWIKLRHHQSLKEVEWIRLDLAPETGFLAPVTLEIKEKVLDALADDQNQYLLWRLDPAAGWQVAATGLVAGKDVRFAVDRTGAYAIFGLDPALVLLDPDFDDPAPYKVLHFSRSQYCEAGKQSDLKLGKDMHLKIGARSLAASTTISADVWIKITGGGHDKTLDWILYDFQPSMVFLRPIQLWVIEKLIESTATPDGQYILWWLNEAASRWEFADDGTLRHIEVPTPWGGVEIKDYIEFDIRHFSQYGISR